MKASTKLANVANGNQVVETAPTPAPTSAATTTTTEVKTAPTPEPVRREGLTDNPNLALTLEEIGVSILALGIWLALLATGITVSAQSFIDPIRSGAPIGMLSFAGCALMIIASHTVTNTAMLCCVAAFLGVIGSRAIGTTSGAMDTVRDRRSSYVAAVTRGFFVFLIIQSGSILLSDQAFTNLTLEKYVRLAGLSSLLSFTVGYNPGLFRMLMDRVNQNFEGQSKTTNQAKTTTTGN